MKIFQLGRSILIYAFNALTVIALFASAAIFANDRNVLELSKERRWEDRGVLDGSIDGKSFVELMASEAVQLIDTRSREDFAKGHLVSALNMPLDEIPMRYHFEVDSGKSVVIYCGSAPSCEQDAYVAGKPTQCGLARREIAAIDPDKEVKFLVGLIPDFAGQGMMVATNEYSLRQGYINESIH